MSSKKEITLYEKDSLSSSNKFYLLMDLLVSNQSTSRTECILLFIIYYMQFIFEFFDQKLNIYDKTTSHVDKIFNLISRIVRLHDLLDQNFTKENLHLGLVIFFILCLILLTILFLLSFVSMTKRSFYSLRESIINYCIKILFYVAYPIMLDYSFSYFSFHEKKPYHIFLCVLLFVYSTIVKLFVQCFYNDTLFLSSSFYAKVSSNFEIFLTFHSILFSLFKFQSHKLTVEFFCIYNIFASIFFWVYYYTRYIYYDVITNNICGFLSISILASKKKLLRSISVFLL